MDFKVTEEIIAINEVIFEGNSEQPVDIDMSLPDYCPDILRILKCQLIPMITSRQMSGDRLIVEGKSCVRLLYVDEECKKVRNFEQMIPFSATFQLKSPPDSPSVMTTVCTEYVNCRAVTGRKIDVHGAFTIGARVKSKMSEKVITDAAGCGIELKKKSCDVTSIIGMAERQFVVSEVLELGPGKPQIESIIRADAVVILQDYKAIANKVILKGEMNIKTLYQCTEGEGDMEIIEHSMPVSQILDLDGVTDECMCDVRLSVASSEIKVKADSNGEYRLISADIKVNAMTSASKAAQVPLICDAYSTRYETECESRMVLLENTAEIINQQGVFKNTYDVPDGGISSVIDVWCETPVTTGNQKDSELMVRSNMNVCVLAYDTDMVPIYFERPAEIEYSSSLRSGKDEIKCEPEMNVSATGYSLSGNNQIEIRVEYRVMGCVYSIIRTKAMCAITPVEEKPITRKNNAALTIYYADSGEDVWDIARKYRTSVNAIMMENELNSNVIDGHDMLLIPIYS